MLCPARTNVCAPNFHVESRHTKLTRGAPNTRDDFMNTKRLAMPEREAGAFRGVFTYTRYVGVRRQGTSLGHTGHADLWGGHDEELKTPN